MYRERVNTGAGCRIKKTAWLQHLSLTQKLTSIAMNCARANSALGFMARVSIDCLTSPTSKTLYLAFVRLQLEYGSIIWSPHQIGLTNLLELVQICFFRLVRMVCGINYVEVSVKEIYHQLGLTSLSQRRELIDLQFLYKLVYGVVKRPELLKSIPFHVLRTT